MYASDLKHSSLTLQDKLYQLYGLSRDKKIDLSFRPPFLDLLKELGNPHLNLPPVIHVAGTNGKGSTIAMMRAMLEAAGKSVHVYTSPHLKAFNERIILAGQMVSDEDLEKLVDQVILANTGRDVTFFEITTALAFKAFSQASADALLLEVGLGGRLDCTNIIEDARVSIIGCIGYDHQAQLGNTLEEIAGEKAGIMKAGVPCVIGAQPDGLFDVFEKHADEVGTPLVRSGSDWIIEKEESRIRFRYGDDSYTLPLPALKGEHQICNAGLALAALKVFDESLSDQHMAEGLKKAHWPARLQKLSYEPRPGYEVWLDGGHNRDAGAVLAKQIQEWKTQDDKPLTLILGMMRHKDHEAFIESFAGAAEKIYVIDIPGEPDCLSADELKTIVDLSNVEQSAGIIETLEKANTGEQGRILIAGSLYLAGEVLRAMEKHG